MSKMFVRLFAIIMIAVLVASLGVGCGNDDNNDSQSGDKNNHGISADVNPEDYRGTTVTYATWKDPELYEDGPVVANFEKEYGIDVEIQLIAQAKYVQTISADIAAGKQGDVFFENGFFPGSLSVMQPLDAAKLDLTDPIWNQAVVKNSTIDGHPYLVDTLSNVWAEVDICVYNKYLFESNNITTPKEYYEAGKWTFENFRKAAADISALGKDYVGASMLGNPVLGGAGSTFFFYEDNKIKTGVDAHLYEVMNFLAKMHDDGLAELAWRDFEKGKHGMAITNCYGLKKNGYFSTMNPDHIAATYMPVWKEGDEQRSVGIYRGWGLIDGSDNPVAAGLFIREYLDVNNYNMENTFQNAEVADFFFEVTAGAADNTINYLYAYDVTGLGENFHNAWNKTPADQMNTYLDSNKHVIDEMLKKCNEMIEAERAIIKKDEDSGKLPKPQK